MIRLVTLDARPASGRYQTEALARALLGLGPDIVCLHDLFGRVEREALAWRLHGPLPFVAGLDHATGLLLASRFPFVDAPATTPLYAPRLAGLPLGPRRGLALTTLDLADLAHAHGPHARLILAHLALDDGPSPRAGAARLASLTRASAAIGRRAAQLARSAGAHPADHHRDLLALITGGLGVAADAPDGTSPIPAAPELAAALHALDPAIDLYRHARPTDLGATGPDGRTSLAFGLTSPECAGAPLRGWVVAGAHVEPLSSVAPHAALVLDLVPASRPVRDTSPDPITDGGPFLPPNLDPVSIKGPIARRHGRYRPTLLERARIAVESTLASVAQPSDLSRSLRGPFASGMGPRATDSHRETRAPRTSTELIDLVATASGELRPVTSRLAQSGIVDTVGTRLDLRELRAIRLPRASAGPCAGGAAMVGPGRGTCTVGGGSSIGQINAALCADTETQTPHDDQVLMNQPGYAGLSFVGCMSVGGHGSGTGLGALASAVTSLTLVHRDAPRHATVLSLDASKPDLFRAALVGLGLCGVISQVTLRLQPAFRIRELRHLTTWRALAAGGLDALIAWNESATDGVRGIPHSFEVWLNLYTGTCVVGRRWKTLAACADRRASAQQWDGWGAVETAFGEVEDRLPRPAEAVAVLLDDALGSVVHGREVVMSAAEGLDFGTTNNFEVLSSAVAVRGTDCKAAVERAIDLARELAFGVGHGPPAVLTSPVGIRYVKNQPEAERPFLAPQFALTERDPFTAMIELPGVATVRGTQRVLDAIVMDLVRALGARPHWGQYLPAAFDRRALESVYDPQELKSFRAARDVLDPTGLFTNAFARKLGL